MRPERFRSGNPRLNQDERIILEASMRPERFRSGNRCNSAEWSRPWSSFNEAGAVPLRKSERLRAEQIFMELLQ